MRSRSRCSSQSGYDQLEKRAMLAGVVYVSLSDQVLTVIGDFQDNAFSIDLTAQTTEQLVQGQDETAIQFTSGFDDGVNLENLQDLRVYTNSGDDAVTINADGFSLGDDLIVSLAHGNDSLYIVGGTVIDDVSIYGGSNHDSVSLSDLNIGDDLYMVGNAGTDVMTLNATNVLDTTIVYGQFGHDTMLVNDSSFGEGFYFEMGGGADRFETVDSSYTLDISLRGRQGFDTVMLDETNVFDRSPHMVNVEREADEPNERGAASESIEQLKADFFVNGSDLPTGTGDGVQNGLSQLASAFDVSLFELELDVIAQTVSVNDPTQTVSVI